MSSRLPRLAWSLRRFTGAVAAFVALTGCASEPPAVAMERRVPPEPLDEARAFFIGHSLIGFTIPSMTEQIAQSLGTKLQWEAQIASGASLKVSWNDHARAEGSDSRVALASGRYDVVVMTEAVKLADMIRWMEPALYGGRFYDLAHSGNPDVRVLFYSTWHRRDEVRTFLGIPRPGGFVDHIEDDRESWEGIVDEIVATRPGASLPMIPGGEAMALLVREIRDERVPHIASEDVLFDDEIHLSPMGSYFMALVHFGAIFRRSPVGATASVRTHEGFPLILEPDTARTLQALAWRALCAYPRSELAQVQ